MATSVLLVCRCVLFHEGMDLAGLYMRIFFRQSLHSPANTIGSSGPCASIHKYVRLASDAKHLLAASGAQVMFVTDVDELDRPSIILL